MTNSELTGAGANLLLQYVDFIDAFSKEEACALPPHRTYDHAIQLELDTKAPWGPLYNMSELELKVLHDYIYDMLQKGFICPSESPAGAPVVFAKKKDSSLCLCVDYRSLNRVMIKNRYPILLINNMLDCLWGAWIYSKIDLHAGYNNICIKEGDE